MYRSLRAFLLNFPMPIEHCPMPILIELKFVSQSKYEIALSLQSWNMMNYDSRIIEPAHLFC